MSEIKAHIVLLGFMGSGKSTIGALVAEHCNLPFIDLDLYIESKEEMTITELFNTRGEEVFRKLEQNYLEEVLRIPEKTVISLGGGTPCFFDNMHLINAMSKISFYLKVGVKQLSARLANSTDRPLLVQRNVLDMEKFITPKIRERRIFYEQANRTIRASDDIDIVVNRITKYIATC